MAATAPSAAPSRTHSTATRPRPATSNVPPTAVPATNNPPRAAAVTTTTPTTSATSRSQTSLDHDTGPARIISTRPSARSATHPDACEMTNAATTGETIAPQKDQYTSSALTPGPPPAMAPMKSNAAHTSITAGCSAAMRTMPPAVPAAHTSSPNRPRRSVAVQIEPSITVGTLVVRAASAVLVRRDHKGAA